MKYFIYTSFCLIGFLIGNLFGAIVAAVAAYWVVRAIDSRRTLSGINDEAWVGPLFQILGYLAKVDGSVSRLEVESALQIMRDLQLDEPLTQLAKTSFNQGKNSDFHLESATKTLTGIFGRGTESAILFFHYMASVCLADHSVSMAEQEALRALARLLGIKELHLRRIFASFDSSTTDRQHRNRSYRYESEESQTFHQASSESDLDEAYKVLGVTKSAADSEVKRKYRKLLNQYHPDKLASKNLPDSMMEFSKQQSAKIIQAWDVIKTARSIS